MHPDALPGRAPRGRGRLILLDAENKAQYHRVTTGALQEDGMRVVTGVDPSAWIVVGGLQQVRARMADITEPVWLRDLATEMDCDEPELRALMLRLAKQGEFLPVVRDLYLTPELAEHYAAIVARLEQEEGAAPAARFRDETGLGRKRAIQILEFFDRVGYTRMARGAHRVRGGASPQLFSSAH